MQNGGMKGKVEGSVLFPSVLIATLLLSLPKDLIVFSTIRLPTRSLNLVPS